MAIDVVARARAVVGSRFRLHGRDPATGLDCIGLVAWAYGASGVPGGYAMRGDDLRVVRSLVEAGFVRVAKGVAGDVVLMRVGAAQVHVGVLTDDGVVHADAGLLRVVEAPLRDDWPVIGIYSLQGGG